MRFDYPHTSFPMMATASNPGVIRNFRVQVLVADGWQMHQTFRHRAQAEACLTTLRHSGQCARLVDCDRCPTAL